MNKYKLPKKQMGFIRIIIIPKSTRVAKIHKLAKNTRNAKNAKYMHVEEDWVKSLSCVVLYALYNI